MAKYGNNGNCYWEIFETKEEALKKWQAIGNIEYVSKCLESGLALLVNSNGGYHCASVSELTDVHESDKGFPQFPRGLVYALGEAKKAIKSGDEKKAIEILDKILKDFE